jgi:hypothetical protein
MRNRTVGRVRANHSPGFRSRLVICKRLSWAGAADRRCLGSMFPYRDSLQPYLTRGGLDYGFDMCLSLGDGVLL